MAAKKSKTMILKICSTNCKFFSKFR